jgi:hypothetical protein
MLALAPMVLNLLVESLADGVAGEGAESTLLRVPVLSRFERGHQGHSLEVAPKLLEV